MTIEELKTKKRILIIGYGVEGRATEAFLKKYCPNAQIGIADKKDGENYLDKQSGYDLAIKSPGVPPDLVTIPYTTVTNIFFANCKGKIIGVTGTKGKSTTCTLIYEMLKNAEKDVYLGGNIGEPPINFLDKLNDESWIVLELSSFQLQDIKNPPSHKATEGQGVPHIAVLLMITSDHLDYHKNIARYVDAKRNILKYQTPNDFAIINRDYPAANESDILTPGKIYYASRERETDNACFVFNDLIKVRIQGQDEKIIKISDIRLRGKHNFENVCAAVMAVKLAGVPTKAIISVLRTFSGLPDRLEYIGEKGGVFFYNDSLSTVPEATIEAIETFSDKVETLIAGGHERGIDYTGLGKYLAKSSVRTMILFPPSGDRIWRAVIEAGGDKQIKKYDVSSMHEAMIFAFEETSSGKICLLSPASASFGIFKNYKDRANQFKKEIEMLY
ncbi:UDP-N-acetylmuramoyl-L-alanine--D-glutamate ligase [Patescibacteria group bacterium]|nr:UDP-N-acetylmuramoyl-L-alanine--D-glutamate ligase [Patescibacteria group bacterium]